MSQSFSFPPPPPPPPRRDNPSASDSRGGFRGRPYNRGHSTRGSHQSPYRGRGTHNNYYAPRGRGNSHHIPHAPKRDFATAFNKQPRHEVNARPTVPDFNIDVQALLSKTTTTTDVEVPKRKNNILGLTPANADASESEDDADDETKLAGASAGEGIQFQHKGQTLSLRTPAEIAAWVAERKKRFPTKVKQDAARREAEERAKRLEEQRKVQQAAMRAKREQRDRERNERERHKLKEKLIAAQVAKARSTLATSKEDKTAQAKLRAEKLRKKAEKAAEQLRSAEEQLRRVEQDATVSTEDASGIAMDGKSSQSEPDSFIGSDEEDTSSSGSSGTDTDLDSGPEQESSKPLMSDQPLSYKQTRRKAGAEEPQPCKNFVKFGRCRYGRKCRFSHKVKKTAPQKPPATTVRRKGLYQVMVEKEQSEQTQLDKQKVGSDI